MKKNNKTNNAEIEEVEEKISCSLTVFSPFREYKRGDSIVDKAEIDKILASHEKNMVLTVSTKE